MPRASRRGSPGWLLLRLWAIAWMLALPLVHVHPDSQPHADRAETHHNGTIHTVFSPDLDGEFTPHPHTAGHAHRSAPSSEQQPDPSEPLAELALHADTLTDAAELAFAVLHDSTDRTELKPDTDHPLVLNPTRTPRLIPIAASSAELLPTPDELRLAAETPVRAPPHSLI